jgi:hypothetical protein
MTWCLDIAWSRADTAADRPAYEVNDEGGGILPFFFDRG